MKIAIYPGSFDPITNGHLDIIERASKLFDKVIVLVSFNSLKKGCFKYNERVDIIRKVTINIKNVEVDSFEGLLSDYVEKVNACVIVKGIRAVADYEYELQMAQANKKLNEKAETIFLPASCNTSYVSSSIVKQIASLGGDISKFIPKQIIQDISKNFELK